MLNTLSSSFRQTSSDLWHFIKNPVDAPDTGFSALGKLRVLLLVLLLDVILSIFLIGVLRGIEALGWYNSESHAVAEMMRHMPLWGFMVLGVIAIPLLEELVFRFGLRFRRGYFAVPFAIMLLTATGFAFYLLPLLWALGVLVALGVLMVLYLLNADAIGDYLEQVWPRKYRIVFYTVALLFGLIHITNFNDFNYASAAVLLVPVIVAPQIWAGLILGYMRVKHGFFWGFFLHAAHNAFFLTLALFFMGTLEEKLNISNENYTLKIEEHILKEPTASSLSHVGHDSIVFENIKLNDVIVSLLQKERTSTQFESNKSLGKTINLRYVSHTGNLAQNRDSVLANLQKLYKFDVTTLDLEQDMWDVELENTTVLAQHIAADTGLYRSTVTPVEITMENATVEQLLLTVKDEFYLHLTDKTAKPGKYNFKLAKNGFKQLRADLQQKYGLSLEPRKFMAEQAVVSFRK
ncbi:membrane protease YdiL (CAAX protease family) [Pontibacter aydingkolensis]|uniref:CPBP family intramembrane metalloprotease n=1 Tax=Pontibacter aydingkolensis TaxID=1911536 RepID=A0ABS7CQ07_9BACT|nr:CPBP family intramembrane glutamic endopeptidase [Pontibacter aydingkolensis]MBW7465926.1 CPBP family intramembrane metalloprotease [Pontibacter aydingkolensis]